MKLAKVKVSELLPILGAVKVKSLTVRLISEFFAILTCLVTVP